MTIRNRDTLASTPARKAALAIADAALEAIDTGAAIRRGVALGGNTLRVAGETLALAPAGRLRLVAVGKSATAAATALADVLGPRLSEGIVLDVAEACKRPLRGMRVLHGTHPMPSPENVEAARAILRFLENARADDVVLCVVSGGASTLLCLPPEGSRLEDERAVLLALIRAGATIQEINTVRKHSSLARGGHLARAARPARKKPTISETPGSGPATQNLRGRA